jgi:hypothetical protein
MVCVAPGRAVRELGPGKQADRRALAPLPKRGSEFRFHLHLLNPTLAVLSGYTSTKTMILVLDTSAPLSINYPIAASTSSRPSAHGIQLQLSILYCIS